MRIQEQHAALLAEMVYALRSEFGAQYVYPALARRTRDAELAAVLERLHAESCEQVEKLRALMSSLGARPAKHRFRRALAARVLAFASILTGMRLPLRICSDAESSVSRWYAGYAAYLARIGEPENARICQELSTAKLRHAQTLETWVQHLPTGRFSKD